MVQKGELNSPGYQVPADFEGVKMNAIYSCWLRLSASEADLNKIGLRFNTLHYHSVCSLPVASPILN